ncbi:MAG: TerB family tellurite resistance protein [Pseudomonadales bacterium]
MLTRLLNRLTQPEQEPEPEGLVAMAAAALLLEVAWADHEISDDELALIERHLRGEFGLSEAEVTELVDESRREHEQSVGLYGYTRTINGAWTEEQKFSLVTALWRLAMADDDLHRYEEHTIRKIAELLYLSHDRFIEAKLRVKRGA